MQIANGRGRNLRQRLVHRFNPEIERLRLQAGASASRAGLVIAVTAEQDADVHLVSLGLKPVEETLYAIPLAMLPGFLGVPAFALENPFLIRLGQLVKRTIHIDVVSRGCLEQIALAFLGVAALERLDHA